MPAPPSSHTGGSRVAGYLVCALVGVPFVFLTVGFFLGAAWAFAAAATAAVIGLTYAARVFGEERLPDS